jgi:hypothetical protein
MGTILFKQNDIIDEINSLNITNMIFDISTDEESLCKY